MFEMPQSATAQRASAAPPRANSAIVEVVNGKVVTNISSSRFWNISARSTVRTSENSAWWLTQMTPITKKLTR